jgi:hypothetical protein
VSDQFLELEIRLLILRYGRQKVLHALAQLGEQTLEELERQLERTKVKQRAKKPKPSIIDIVAAECREHPELAEPLRNLALGFQNRTFLPHLREVHRFLDRIGSTQSKVRSREAAAPILFRLLAKLTREDLLRLVADINSPGASDYALLARAIMGPRAAKPRNLDEPGEKPTKS